MENIPKNAFKITMKLLDYIFSIHPDWVIFFGIMVTMFYLLGERLSICSKPDSPYLSNMIRSISNLFNITSKLSLITIGLLLFALGGAAYLANIEIKDLFTVISSYLEALLAGLTIGFALSMPIIWRVIPEWERGEGLTNPDEILKKLRKLKNFDPLEYIDIKRGCFVGKNYYTKKSVFVPWSKINQSHLQALGASSSGKNVQMLLVVYQCILQGQGLVWFDPKSDRRSPFVIAQAAKKSGKKFHYINLNPAQPSQFNLLSGCSESEIEELLVAGFDLIPKGSEGDFHRGKDEDAATLAAKVAINENAKSVPQLLELCSKIDEISGQENFWRKFKKISSLPVINTQQGLNFERAILEGDVIYIHGGFINEKVKMLQKMLLVRVMQIIIQRDRSVENTQICVVLDEFKHMLSPMAANALGVVRDFDSHFLLAHQSMGDLEEAVSVSPAVARGAVVNNTALKSLFKINDVQHAQNMSELAGKKTIYTDNASKSVESCDGQASSKGTWTEDRDYRIPQQVITNLPMPPDRDNQATVGVFYGHEDAQIIYLGPIKAMGKHPKVVEVESYSLHAPHNGNLEELI